MSGTQLFWATQALAEGHSAVVPTSVGMAFVHRADRAPVLPAGCAAPIALVGNAGHLPRLVARAPHPRLLRVLDALWPGPFVALLPARASVPAANRMTDGTVALLLDDTPTAMELLHRLDTPLVARAVLEDAGRPVATLAEADARIGLRAGHSAVDGPLTLRPHLVVDFSGARPLVLHDVPALRARLVEAWGDDVLLA